MVRCEMPLVVATLRSLSPALIPGCWNYRPLRKPRASESSTVFQSACSDRLGLGTLVRLPCKPCSKGNPINIQLKPATTLRYDSIVFIFANNHELLYGNPRRTRQPRRVQPPHGTRLQQRTWRQSCLSWSLLHLLLLPRRN